MNPATSIVSRKTPLIVVTLLAAMAWAQPGAAQGEPGDAPTEDSYEEPDGKEPPDGAQVPDGEQVPDGAQVPDGEQAPDGEQVPDGQQAPDTERPPDGAGGDPAVGSGQNDSAAAESLRRVGRGLLELGQYQEACPKLELSFEAKPSADTALLLSTCLERQGKIASAWASYRQAAAILQAAGDARFVQANDRAIDLEPKVPRLTIVPAVRVPRMEVWRGGTRFSAGIFGVPVAVDPGVHKIEIRAEGYQTWTTEVTLRASERTTVAVPALVEDVPPPLTVLVRRHRGPLFTAGVISAGVGMAGVAIGALLGASASRDVQNAKDDESLCGLDQKCTPAGMDVIDGADSKAVASTALFGIGATAVAAGFVMVLLDKGSTEQTEGVAQVTPLVGPTGGGLSLRGTF